FKFVNHDPLKPVVTENEKHMEYLLTRGNIPAFKAVAQQKMPYFIASTWETWDEFIGWWYPLYHDKIVSDDSIKNTVSKLITGKQKPFDKAKSISEWVRDNIRYVAVEYGDAGYEPREASYIYRQRYGDCKDKAVLTIAMLKQAQISAYPVMVSTGRDVEDDFPSNQFNHLIIAVPTDTAMIFFDPTDTRYDYGFISSKYVFRKQAVITGNKISFMQPVYYLSRNEIAEYLWLNVKDKTVQGNIKLYFFGKINNKVSKELNIADQSKRDYKCEEYIISGKMLYGLSAKELEYRILTGDSSYISADISSYPIMHETEQQLYLNLAACGSKAKTFYFYPRKNKSSFKSESFKRTAVIEFALAPGTTVISLPVNKEVKNQFGKFFRRYSVVENKILLELEENYEQFEFTREDFQTTKVNDYTSIEDYFTSVTGEFIVIKKNK
ncbi:MAG: transglutaminase domain-containing protein, partial [Ignavibacteria bacterium]|nr:transglutaminase domain-containing protein [Ignavibacteria bacterium]